MLQLYKGGKTLYTGLFWKDTFERLVATLSQVALGLLATDLTSFASIPWEAWLMTLFVAGVSVVLKALAASKTANTVSPASFAPAAPDKPAVSNEDPGDTHLGISF